MVVKAALVPLVISPKRAAELFAKALILQTRWATYEFALRGLSPLLMDRITEEQKKSLVTKAKVEYPKDETFTIKALRRLYSDVYDEHDMPAGLVVIPGDNVYAGLRDAGEKVQFGSGKNDRITLSSKGTELFGMLRLHEPFFPVLGLDGKPIAVADLRKQEFEKWAELRKGNATQGKKGAIGIIRPIFREWGIVGHVDINVAVLRPDVARLLFEIMGIRQGLCSARPSKKMPFGQCGLTHFEWVGGVDPKTVRQEAAEEGARQKGRRGRGKNRISRLAGDGDGETDS